MMAVLGKKLYCAYSIKSEVCVKLNIWVIAAWLEEYNPILTVTGGSDEIEGFRFLTGYHTADRRHIYIGRAKDFLSDNSSEEILLVHENDVISLRSTDMDDISDKVLECFEFYNNWEETLFEAAQQDRPEQRIVDACDNMIGPIFIMDLKLNLIAYSKNYKLGEINPIWDEYIQMNRPSLKTIQRMNSSSSNKLMPFRQHCFVYKEPLAAPYSYGILVSYCDKDNTLIGQCALCADHPITGCELCLARTIEAALLSVTRNMTDNLFNNLAQSIVYNALSTGDFAEDGRKKLLALMGWEQDGPFQVIALGMDGESRNSTSLAYLNRLSVCFGNSVGLIFKEQLVFIHQEKDLSGDRLYSTCLGEVPLHAGISYTFDSLEEMPVYFRQAQCAMSQGIENNKSLTHFSDCAYHVLVFDPDREFCRYCIHPGVKFLRRADDNNMTPYCLTLFKYLQLERSYIKTAQYLFVHRNTIVYRLEKIHELFHFDLDNPDEREYIILSFRLLGL